MTEVETSMALPQSAPSGSTFRKRNSSTSVEDSRDALARQGDRRRSVAGRAARDDAGTRAAIGRQIRLAHVRGETRRFWARIYWENKFSYFNAKNHSVPTAVSVFPGEQYQAPRSWTERAYHKLIYYNKVDKGGHFAAWEQPQLFSEEIRAAFRSLCSSWPAALIQNWL